MKKAFMIPLALMLLTCSVYAQFPTNIQIAINQLVTGVIPFQNQVFIPAGYANWDSTKGVNGYGIRGNSGVMEFKDFGGAWTPFASGSGSPADARYWVGVANGGLTNEIVLGALGTGILLNTTVTGVPTIYTGTSCTNQFISALSAVGVATCASVTPTDFSGTLPVTKGGTGLTSGTSGGIPYYSAGTAMASSAALTANRLVLGGGAGAAPTVLGSLGTTTTLLHGNAAGAPTFGAVTLTTDVTGILPGANGGTANGFFAVTGPATTVKTFTFPNASSTVLTTNAAVTPAQGGTGISSYTIGDLLYASGATTLSKLADVATGNALISGGVATAPSWGKIGLTTHVTGTLGATNGGTGIASYVIGDLLSANSTTTLSRIAAGALGTTLVSNGPGVLPSWGAAAIQVASDTLTNAEIKALPTMPITLVASPGMGFRIKPIGLTLYVNTITAGYTGMSAMYSALQITTGSGFWLMLPVANDNTLTTPLADLTALLGSMHYQVADFSLLTEGISGGATSGTREWNQLSSSLPATSDVDDSAVVLSIDNGMVDLGGGDSMNALTYRFYYMVEALP